MPDELYTIRFASSAAREFRALHRDVKRRVGIAIDNLSANPRPPGVRKLLGHAKLYRVRVGQYRIIYEIQDDTRLITVTYVRHRNDAYSFS